MTEREIDTEVLLMRSKQVREQLDVAISELDGYVLALQQYLDSLPKREGGQE